MEQECRHEVLDCFAFKFGDHLLIKFTHHLLVFGSHLLFYSVWLVNDEALYVVEGLHVFNELAKLLGRTDQ